MKRSLLILTALFLALACFLTSCVTAPVNPTTGPNTSSSSSSSSGPDIITQPPTGPTTSRNCTALGHLFTAKMDSEPTCTAPGHITYTCSACGATKEETVKSSGHIWVMPGTYTAGTCKQEGYTTVACAICGENKTIDDTAKAPHQFVDGECTVCHTTTVKTEVTSDPYYDSTPMPDRYNTGMGSIMYMNETVTKGIDVTSVTVAPGVTVTGSGDVGSRSYKISVDYRKVGAVKEVVISNFDFSDGTVSFGTYNFGDYAFTEDYGTALGDGLYSDPTGGRFTIKLVNCSMLRPGNLPRGGSGNVCYYFDHCSFKTVGQCSNSVFNWCYIGGNVQEDRDGMNPMQNVFVYNTYVADMGAVGYGNEKDELHVDATQIYGYDPWGNTNPPVEAKNLHHNNYRCEMPSVYYTGSFSYTNSCLMVSLDYTDAYDITFAHCFINGAGCPVMINDHPHMNGGGLYGKNNGNYNMYRALYKDIIHGCGSTYDEFTSNTGIKSQSTWNESNYKQNPDYLGDTTGRTEEEKKAEYMSTVTLDNWNQTVDVLYVGSVWEKDGLAHFSVTNDTYSEREITIFTSNGTSYNFGIQRYLRKVDFPEDISFFEFPVDIDVTIPETADWYACFDSTNGTFKQIRFVSKTVDSVTLDLQQAANDWKPATHTYRFIKEGTGFWGPVANETDENGDPVSELAYNKYKASNGFYITGNNIHYRLTSDGTLTISGTGAMPSLSQFTVNKSDYVNYLSRVTKLVIEPGVTSVAAYTCYGMYNLKEVILPAGLTHIGDYAFSGCNSLTTIKMPVSLTTIGTGAFENCTSLTRVVLPENVSTVGTKAFAGCVSLREAVILSSGLTRLPSEMFRSDISLACVTLSSGLTTVNNCTFLGCTALTEIRFCGTEEDWKQVNLNVGTNPAIADTTLILVDANEVKAAVASEINYTVRQTPTYTTNVFRVGSDTKINDLIGRKYVGNLGSAKHDLAFFVELRTSFNGKPGAGRGEGAFTPNHCPCKAYDGEAFDLNFATDSDGEVTIKWMKGTYIVGYGAENAPVDPGCYVAVITVAGTENFESLEIHQMFFIIDTEA